MKLVLNAADNDTAKKLSLELLPLFDAQPVRIALVSLQMAMGAILCTSAATEKEKEEAREIAQGIAETIKKMI